VQQVAHYEIDLGLIEGDCSHPDLEVQPWVEDELVVFCAPQHPLAKAATPASSSSPMRPGFCANKAQARA
jgi:DNA-binding transcriptional LysR family regulator